MNITFDPFREFNALRGEINRLFDGLPGVPSRSQVSRSSFRPSSGARSYPLLNVSEDEESVYIEALMPGVDPDSLDVSVLGRQVTISGEKPAPKDVKEDEFHRNERGAGRFSRSINLSVDVDDAKVKADYKQGILSITLPKAPSAKPRKVEVTTG